MTVMAIIVMLLLLLLLMMMMMMVIYYDDFLLITMTSSSFHALNKSTRRVQTSARIRTLDPDELQNFSENSLSKHL